MADAGTIIDKFLVEVGLDPAGFEDGRKKISDEYKKLREDSEVSGKRIEEGAGKASQGIVGLTGSVLRMTLAFAGAASISTFLDRMTKGDAATGRMAANIGMLTGEVSAWGGAVKKVGGEAVEAETALREMNRALQDYQLTGRTAHDIDYRALGLTVEDLQDPAQALLKIAENADRMGRPEFAARLERIGMSEGMINLLAKGRGEVEKLLEEQRRLNPVTEENARKAEEFQAALSRLKDTAEGLLRPVLYDFVEFLDLITGKSEGSEEAINGLTNALMGVSVVAAIAGAPLIAIGAAIGAIALNWDKLKQTWSGFEEWWNGITKRYGSDAAGEWFNSQGTWGAFGNNKPASGGEPVKPSREARAASGGAVSRMSRGADRSGFGGTDNEIFQALKARYGAEIAYGVSAGILAEGGAPNAVNPTSGAFGIGQWLGSRQKELFRRYGRSPSKQQQLEFLMWELEGGDWGGKSVLASKNRDEALSNYIGGYGWGFMRPSTRTDNSGRIGDMRRGNAALADLRRLERSGGYRPSSGGATINVSNMTIQSSASNPMALARDMQANVMRRVTVNQFNGGAS